MFRWIRGIRSFGSKVTLLVTFASGVAVLVVSTALAGLEYLDMRRELDGTVASQALIVAMNSSAPLAFDDRATAFEAIGALRAAPNIVAATLFDANGAPFASYRRSEFNVPELGLQTPGISEHGDWLVLVKPISDRGQSLGNLQVVYGLDQVFSRVWLALLLTVGVALTAMAVAYVLAKRTKDVLVKPVNELARAARAVSATKDYGIRAEKYSDDELGAFTDTFNAMLDQIQAQASELETARIEAERASQVKDEFLATLSHELRTPMTPILGWAQILRRTNKDDAQLQQAAEVIERNAFVQTRIIDDLLDMSRIISGKLRLDMKRVDPVDVIDAAVEIVRPTALARGVELVVVLDRHAGLVRGDPERLQQVLWNLLSNAIKFTRTNGRVDVVLARVAASIEIRVSDTGQGIPAEFLPHVFERFRQADSSTTRQHGGLGLGLAIVRQLVELHGGNVSVWSEGTDRGATFCVTLPLIAKSDDPLHAGEWITNRVMAASDRPRLDRIRVLVVDDEPDARALIGHVLENEGAIVHRVDGTSGALASLMVFRPDVLVCDIGMPDSDGYDLIHRLRILPANAGGTIPAIALTAFARREDRDRALHAGYQQHVAKPVEAQELVAAIVSVVAGA